jgi:hypothetical protein
MYYNLLQGASILNVVVESVLALIVGVVGVVAVVVEVVAAAVVVGVDCLYTLCMYLS